MERSWSCCLDCVAMSHRMCLPSTSFPFRAAAAACQEGHRACGRGHRSTVSGCVQNMSRIQNI